MPLDVTTSSRQPSSSIASRPVEVALPLVLALDVVAPVVLHDHPHARPGQVVAADGRTVDIADRGVDLGFGQAREDDEHPQTRLHRRVDPVADQGRGSPGGSDAGHLRRRAEVDQPREGAEPSSDEVVTDDHEVHEAQQGRQLDEHLPRVRDPEPADHHDGGRRADVAAHAVGSASKRRGRDGDVLERVSGKRNAVHARRGAMAGEPAPSKRSSAASTRRSGESGASAATETPRKMCRKREPRSTFGEIPAASASARVNGRRMSSGSTRPGCPGSGGPARGPPQARRQSMTAYRASSPARSACARPRTMVPSAVCSWESISPSRWSRSIRSPRP